MENNIEILINHVNQIMKKKQEEAQNTGSKFNIFNIIGISTREVYMCRVLAELLDPKGCHCQGAKYLDLFIKLLAKKSKRDYLNEIKRENVIIRKEDPTKYLENHENRRIDIVINEKDGYYIPIEVKINADEQEKQCHDYLQQAEKYYVERGLKQKPFVCFLTKSGYMPLSIDEEYEKTKIICLSWKEDILTWLDECIEETPEKANPIKEILNQFHNAIKQFLQGGGDEVMSDIADYLLKNKDTIEQAINIREGVNIALDKIWEKIYNNIKELLKDTDWKIAKCSKEWFLEYSKDDMLIHINALETRNIKTGKFKITKYKYNNEKKVEKSSNEYSFLDFVEKEVEDFTKILSQKLKDNDIIPYCAIFCTEINF